MESAAIRRKTVLCPRPAFLLRNRRDRNTAELYHGQKPGRLRDKASLCVTNDTRSEVTAAVHWALRDADSNILKEGSHEVHVAPLGVQWLGEMDFHKTDVLHHYLSYDLAVDGAPSQWAQYCLPHQSISRFAIRPFAASGTAKP